MSYIVYTQDSTRISLWHDGTLPGAEKLPSLSPEYEVTHAAEDFIEALYKSSPDSSILQLGEEK